MGILKLSFYPTSDTLLIFCNWKFDKESLNNKINACSTQIYCNTHYKQLEPPLNYIPPLPLRKKKLIKKKLNKDLNMVSVDGCF